MYPMDPLPDSPPPTPKKSLKAIAGHVLTIVAAILAVRITMSVPQFAHQFTEGPFNPPAFTLAVIRCYPALLVVAVIVVLGAIYLAWRYRSVAPPAWILIVLTIVIGAQVLIVGLAMFLPMRQFIHRYLGS
jgi:hypothetical protein